MKKIVSKLGLPYFILFLLLLLHIPVIFGKSTDLKIKSLNIESNHAAMMLYKRLSLDSLGLSLEAYQYAVQGFENLKCQGKFTNSNIITVIDFTKPSYEKRMFVIDLNQPSLLFNTYVAHGQQSGTLFAEKFSNKPSSYQSSLGFYETKEPYIGKHGYSLELNGLEKGFNDKADARAIVVHGAAYVSEGIIKTQGYLGRSWGCPAIPDKLSKPVIDVIKSGTCMFIYARDNNYLSHSSVLKAA